MFTKSEAFYDAIYGMMKDYAVEARLADDTWTPMGLLPIAKVERWEILLGASKPAQEPC
jgi:hypothetical protein